MDLYNADNYTDGNYDTMLDDAAQFCHEANRAYCESLGDHSQPKWEDAPEWQKSSAILGVSFHFTNPTADASASHQSWFEEKQRDGWSYGPVKDPENKKHPCFVPFKELPIEQQIKDHVFRSAVHAYIQVYGPNYIGT